jgi:hypothetical protein
MMPTNPSSQDSTIASADLDIQTALLPIGDLTAPGGYAAPGLSMSEHPEQQTKITQLASKVVDNALLMQKLSDRVYQLMQADIQSQQERRRNYGGSLS